MRRKGLQSSFIIKTYNKVQSIWINLHVKYTNTFQDINFPWLMKSFKHLTNSIICNNNIIWPRKALNIWPFVVLLIFMWSWLVCDILKHTYDRNISKRTPILWQMARNFDITSRLYSGRLLLFVCLDGWQKK